MSYKNWRNQEAGFWGEVWAVLMVFNFGLSFFGLWAVIGFLFIPNGLRAYNTFQPSDIFWFSVSFLGILVSWGISFPLLWEFLATPSEDTKYKRFLAKRDADWVKREAEFNAGWVKRDAGWVKRDNAKLDAEQVAYKAKLEADKAKREADKLADAEANKAYKRIMAEHQAKAKRKNKDK